MSDRPDHARPGRSFWIGAVGGWAGIAFGIRGLFHHHIDTRPANLARFAVGGALVHDLILAPLLLGAGWAVARVVSPRVRGPVQAALIVSGTLVLFAYPLVRDYAHVLHNPSSLPYDYAANLAVVVGAVWAATVCVVVVQIVRSSNP